MTRKAVVALAASTPTGKARHGAFGATRRQEPAAHAIAPGVRCAEIGGRDAAGAAEVAS